MIQPHGLLPGQDHEHPGLAAALLERYDGRGAAAAGRPGHAARESGRKTANVVLGNAFGVPGITVDTHFGRLSRRMGWTTEEDPVKVELEVGALFPKRDWTMLSQRPDLPRAPHLPRQASRPAGPAPSRRWCPSYGEGETDPVLARGLLKYERATEAAG